MVSVPNLLFVSLCPKKDDRTNLVSVTLDRPVCKADIKVMNMECRGREDEISAGETSPDGDFPI